MRDDTPSFTASWVAAMRGLGAFLPERVRLVDDPYGVRFSKTFRRFRNQAELNRAAVATRPLWFRGPIRRFAVYMQLRTRAIDDDVEAFVQSGGRQLVLLGAGFDCRAWRLSTLANATVFEVDHPATQAKKLAVMASEPPAGRVVYVPWNFERPLSELPAKLAELGHDPTAPTMTVLEGVLMYLTQDATDATFDCIRRYSPPGSPTSMTYQDKSIVTDHSPDTIARRFAVSVVGEPFRNGFEPSVLPGWFAERGFRLDRDESASQVGVRLFGPAIGKRIDSRRSARSHFALIRTV